MTWRHVQTSASLAFLRTLLFFVNLIFILSGGLLVILGIALRSHFKEFLEITPEMKSSSPYVVMGLGIAVLFIGLLAFWCTIRGHITLLYIYSIIILLILIAEVILAVTIIMKKQTYESSFKTSVRKIMLQYPRTSMSSHVDHLQRALSCCGVDSYTDWFETSYGSSQNQVPLSCCKKSLNHTCIRTNLQKDNLPTDLNINGCYPTVLSAIKSNYPIFGGIILAIALFPLMGIILSCCLAHQLSKHRYEPVD
ncbi:hypothetical protein I4U23_025480 [Adineta vaga]|nr:hypothetical protein I4U23_025480 [Adineta vaga]